MIAFDEALALIIEHTPMMPESLRPIRDALGQILAGDLRTDEPVPPFDSSAMDGFGVRAGEVEGASKRSPVPLRVQAEIRPGMHPLPALEEGAAFRIFTGSPLPPGVDSIVIKEHAKDEGYRVLIERPAGKGEHIRPQGAEFRKGETVFPAGTLLTPPVAGMLASLGRVEARVHAKPDAAIIVTGDELRPPSERLEPGRIREANSYSLAAALEALRIRTVLILRARDDADETAACFEQALEAADVVLSTGGVSVGKYDFVKDALGRLGVETLFWRVAMKPGKPNFFGRQGRRLVFGLPGNTVSTLVSFFLLARPALLRLMGCRETVPPRARARLDGTLKKSDPRLEFVRGRLIHGEEDLPIVRSVTGRDSHMLGNLALSDCLILFPAAEKRLAPGDVVEVIPLRWSAF